MTPPPIQHKKSKKSKKKKPHTQLSSPEPKRINALRELKLFDRHYTQESAAKQLHVSVSTIKRDEEIIRNQDQKWSYDMAKGGFMAYVKEWFSDEIQEINNLRGDIKKIRVETTSRVKRSVDFILEYNDSLPPKEKAFVESTLFEFQLQSLTSSHAGAITLIDNTIANLMKHCEDLVLKYPLLKTTQDYKEYVETMLQ